MKTYLLFFFLLSLSIFSCTIRTSKNGEELTIDFDGQKFSQALEEANAAILKSELGCDYIMTNAGLDSVLEEVDDTWFASNKLDVVRDQIKEKNACLNIYQVVSMIDYIPEDDRFEFARFAYGRTVDRYDFDKVKAYLKDEAEKEKLEAIYENDKGSQARIKIEGGDLPKQTIKIDTKELESVLEDLVDEIEASTDELEIILEEESTEDEINTTIESTCTNPTLNDAEFEKITEYIYEGHMASDKLERAKRLANKRCLSVAQIKDIIEVINFPDEQVLFAKYAFSRATDPQNYCKVKKAVFATHRNKITEFCKRKGLTCGTSKMERMIDNM
ncbi:DUF4476 domain-containing protein [Bernardetia sp.]|uniref:DUF4476 domain-containing protein n=1 Tax=Bernardetia sp. TaxID=1937974 RepID=UPI0025B92D5B|nr:DUF4476 domain-containing protein [Bernardetia sp.]